MSEQTVLGMFTSIVGFLTMAFAGVMSYFMAKLKAQSENAAKVLDATHVLVNSQMGVQLRLNAVVTRRVADLTKDPHDIAIAAESEAQLREHEQKQAQVDAATPNLKKAAD